MEDPVEQSNSINLQKKLWIAQSITKLLAKIFLGIGNGLPSKFCSDNPKDGKCEYWTKVNNFIKKKSDDDDVPMSTEGVATELLTGGAAASTAAATPAAAPAAATPAAAPAADGDASGKFMAIWGKRLVKPVGR